MHGTSTKIVVVSVYERLGLPAAGGEGRMFCGAEERDHGRLI
jgi:hypothetical protein